MTAESLQCHSKFCYNVPTNSTCLFLTSCSPPAHSSPIPSPHLWSFPVPSFFPSIIPSSLPGLVDINLEHSHFPMVLHVALHMSEREALWPTSISVACQDLWVMESKPDRSESVLLQTTPGPLWDVMDEHPCPPSPPPLTLSSFQPPSSPRLCTLHFISHGFSCPLPISPVLSLALAGSSWSII